VESVTSRKSPRGLEVFAQVVDLLDSSDESIIDGLEVSMVLVIPQSARPTFCSDFLASGTSTFSCPSPKNCPSLPALTPLALAKKASLTDSGTETDPMSTLVEVAIT
jgi:hypothetical protein